MSRDNKIVFCFFAIIEKRGRRKIYSVFGWKNMGFVLSHENSSKKAIIYLMQFY